MKKQDQTVENMIMQAHYLEALEIESKAQKPLAEMERQDFINTITELKAMISSLNLNNSYHFNQRNNFVDMHIHSIRFF